MTLSIQFASYEKDHDYYLYKGEFTQKNDETAKSFTYIT